MSRLPLFPHDTVVWATHEISQLRAATLSAVVSGAVTGVLVRLVRLAAFVGDAGPLVYLAAWVVGLVVLCGMLTVHLAHYPIRRWPLRVAAFLLAEVTAEMATSALLIVAGIERRGTGAAHLHDLPDMATTTFVVRGVILILFAAVLAATVQLVRSRLPKHTPEHRPGHS